MQDEPVGPTAIQMLAEKEAKMLALIGKQVFWRHESGVQFLAIIVRSYSPQVVNLLVFSDGYIDLGAGPGLPVPKTSVPFGPGNYAWTWDLDK